MAPLFNQKLDIEVTLRLPDINLGGRKQNTLGHNK